MAAAIIRHRPPQRPPPADTVAVVERPGDVSPALDDVVAGKDRHGAVGQSPRDALRPAARPSTQRLSSAWRRGTESTRAAPILARPPMAAGRSPRMTTRRRPADAIDDTVAAGGDDRHVAAGLRRWR
ncbi:MAG: hypothetical protein JSW31_04585, partial [Burkholderiales bacterium]